ncbi:MAG: hypothetical protein A2452_11855 [Candidatus Firestonebacteria bacterium RIFOXYC2_FULL_39_67]|nr:MAG: hypothetical protein A2536_07455 [Candidatus Firestonebacteria bacterium RIFOXYD2_FULL_39_29]OGF53913.1 MAG: hypothetical protein A2452_11855 [Candidatus Firestonebacteria bacterium RIFOXYC2_FULL_39_67]
MIKLKRINGAEILVNVDLIEIVEHHGDTIIHLTNGNKIVVSDSLESLQKAIIEYKKAIYEKN